MLESIKFYNFEKIEFITIFLTGYTSSREYKNNNLLYNFTKSLFNYFNITELTKNIIKINFLKLKLFYI